MRKVAFLLLPLLLFVFSCGSKKTAPPPSKEEQLRKAEEAFRELEREANKPAKDLQLEEERFPKREEPKLKRAPVELAKRDTPRTKYPVVDGLPVWVRNPNYGGVLGGVGIAKKIPGKGYAEQKRLAKQIALADLAKQVELIVKTEITKEEINVDTQTVKYYRKKFSSYSEQEVKTMLIRNAVIEDEWIDPKTGDLYLWLVVK